MKLLYPLEHKYPITSKFGMRMHPILKIQKMHKGIDIGCPTGTKCLACIDADIQYLYQKDGAGYYIVLSGKTDQNTLFRILYMHLSDWAGIIDKKKRVKQGELIAYTGNTGASAGAHLHFQTELYNPKIIKYEAVEPTQYFIS